MIKVKICRNYKLPLLERQSPAIDGIWNNLHFSEKHIGEVDFCIILNYPEEDVVVRSNKGGTWLFLQEPPDAKNIFYTNYFKFADRVYSGFGDKVKNGFNETISLPWLIDKSYQELKDLSHIGLNKTDKISWITSNSNMVAGHELRLGFIKYLKEQRFEFDLFGRGFNPIQDKFQALADYKYSIAIENYSSENYWTEKIQDCFLSWTMPVYFGCTNLEKYFPKESFIQIDLNNMAESLEIIREAIKDDCWSKNINAIAEARQLILEKYQLFPYVENLVNEYLEKNANPLKKKYVIRASGNSFWKEIKTKIKSRL